MSLVVLAIHLPLGDLGVQVGPSPLGHPLSPRVQLVLEVLEGLLGLRDQGGLPPAFPAQ